MSDWIFLFLAVGCVVLVIIAWNMRETKRPPLYESRYGFHYINGMARPDKRYDAIPGDTQRRIERQAASIRQRYVSLVTREAIGDGTVRKADGQDQAAGRR